MQSKCYKQKTATDSLIPQETICVPRVTNNALNTLEVCPSNVFKQEPSDIAYIFIVLSPDAVTTHWSTGENSTDQIPLLWPLNTFNRDRVNRFQKSKQWYASAAHSDKEREERLKLKTKK